MNCAAIKNAPRSIAGNCSLLASDSFRSLCLDCRFHNIDARIGEMFMADAADFGEYRWEAHSLEGRPDIIEAAVTNPDKHFGVKRLLAWEARAYHTAKSGMHRAVALGTFVVDGSDRYFLSINRKNNGLVTIGLVFEGALPLLDDIYYLRAW